jgi:hypothetical protein
MLKALLKCNLQYFAENIQIIAILPKKYLQNLLLLFLQFEEIAISSSTLGAD